MELKGHTALVTGGGRRLGRAFAEGIAARGGSIAVHYHASREEAESSGGVAIQADLSDPSQASALLERAVESAGEIDLLVNSASIFESPGPMETDLATWQRHLDVNLTAPFLISQAFARHRSGRSGAIVNILDWRGGRPGVKHFAYTIAKAGLAAMTRSLAQALAPNIRVNGLALGAILPPPQAAEIGADVLKRIPSGRAGTVEETVETLLFLLTGPEYITGEILHLDGGRQLK